MVPPVDINMAAVVAAAAASFVIGMIWYSPMAFGKLWMRLSGLTDKKLTKAKKKGMGKTMALGFLSGLIMSYVLAHFVDFAQATTAVGGMEAGFWAWLGFVATVTLGGVLWEGKPAKLWLLNATHWLVVLLVMGALLAVWA